MKRSHLAWATCAVLAACGGATSPIPSGDASSGGGGSGSGASSTSSSGGSGISSSGTSGLGMNDPKDSGTTTTTPTPCPSSAPADGTSCSDEGLECEYGTALFFTCDVVATCTSGKWSIPPPPPNPCSGLETNGPSCPAKRAEVEEGVACSPQAVCQYPEGVCWCASDHTGAPQIWTCYPEAGCPAQRPRLGTTCASKGLTCDYAGCGLTVACSGGRWIEGTGACHP